MNQQDPKRPSSSAALAIPILLVAGVLAYAYWPSLRMLTRVWETPDYSHGWLVPPFAALLLYIRRDMFQLEGSRGSWWGAALILLSALAYVGAEVLGFKLIGAFSLLPCLAGIALTLGGWSMLRWSWPAIVFLGFMIPLPMALETAATYPLRRIGTIASTYILQTCNLPAVAEGNVINLSNQTIGVAEACSGLRMLMTSVALAFALVIIINRPWWERVIILLSAVPIALITNIIRIVVTGLCYEYFSKELAEKVFHDYAGYMMMPMAALLLWAEMTVLSHLTIEPEQGPRLSRILATSK